MDEQWPMRAHLHPGCCFQDVLFRCRRRMLMRGVLPVYSPCPALACIELLKRSDISIHNKKVWFCTRLW